MRDDMEAFESVHYGQEEHLRLVRQAHLVRRGGKGVDCLAFGGENTTLTVIDDWVVCPVCGCELGKTSQFMLQVLEQEPALGGPALGVVRLAFVG